MDSIEIRLASSNDLPRLMAMDHSCSSDYVWQLELQTEPKRVAANFHEVRLPRSVPVTYPRDPLSLVDDWSARDILLVALQGENPVGYAGAVVEPPLAIVRITDLVVSAAFRRQGIASTLLTAIQDWSAERSVRRIILETQSKNHPFICLAQKFGYEFCGYNDRYYPTQDVALFFGRALK